MHHEICALPLAAGNEGLARNICKRSMHFQIDIKRYKLSSSYIVPGHPGTCG